MAHINQTIELHVGPQGRIVIPVELRRTLKIETGTTLVAHIEADRIVLEKQTQIMKRVQARFAALVGQASLAESLIEERRAEAKRDTAV